MARLRPHNESGQRLRLLRKQRRVSGRELARKLHQDQSRISRIESGKTYPTRDDIDAFARGLGLSEAERNDLHALHDLYESEVLTPPAGRLALQQERIRDLESSTKIFRWLSTSSVPGLLQTPEYARSICRLFPPGVDEVEFIRARLERQRILQDRGRSFMFTAMEYALRNRICAPDVLSRQLRHVLDTVDALPHVSFGVVPVQVSLPTMPIGTFCILDEKLVVHDTIPGFVTFRAAEDVATHRAIYEQLHLVSVRGPDATLYLESMIAEIARDSVVSRFQSSPSPSERSTP